MNWDSICFDLDNTLFDYEQTFQLTMEYCFQHISTRYGYAIPTKTWFASFKRYCDYYWPDYASGKLTTQQYKRNRYISSMADFQIQVTSDESDLLQKKFNESVAHFVRPFPGIKTLLMTLRDEHIKLGIITNGNLSIQMKKIAGLGLSPFFPHQTIFVSEEYQIAKPNPTIFQIAQHTLQADSCLYIGDSLEHDVVGAKKAGWDVVYFNTRRKPMENENATKICYNIDELSSFLLCKDTR